MVTLLEHFSIQTIFMFVVLLSLAIKGLISFIDWAIERTRKAVHHAEEPELLKDNIQEHSQEIDDIKDSLKQLTNKVDMLIDSDRDDIKAYITKEHHWFVYQRGWIDDYSLNCIEKRYTHYKKQGGNSFIADLMREIRALPKQEQRESD